MATHSSTLAWKIPQTEEPGGLPSMGSHRVGHDWSDLAAAAAAGDSASTISTEEIEVMQSMRLQRVGHNLGTEQHNEYLLV